MARLSRNPQDLQASFSRCPLMDLNGRRGNAVGCSSILEQGFGLLWDCAALLTASSPGDPIRPGRPCPTPSPLMAPRSRRSKSSYAPRRGGSGPYTCILTLHPMPGNSMPAPAACLAAAILVRWPWGLSVVYKMGCCGWPGPLYKLALSHRRATQSLQKRFREYPLAVRP